MQHVDCRARTGQRVLLALALMTVAILAGCAAPSHAASQSPTATPTATPTAEQRIAALAQRAAGLPNKSVTATFDGAAGGTLTLIATIGGPVPGTKAEIAAAQERVKAICFLMERAAWTGSMPMPPGVLLSDVKVVVVGPIYDDYADLTTGPYGAADLKAVTAHQLDWTHLTPDAAWEVYATWLRPAYRSAVVGL